jgi:glucose/arabinose dehydrogenase
MYDGSLVARLVTALAGFVIVALVSAWPKPVSSDVFGSANTLPPTVPRGFLIQPAGVAPLATSLSFAPDGKTLYAVSNAGRVLRFPVIGGKALGPPFVYATNLDSPLGLLATQHGVFVSAVLADGKGGVLRLTDQDGNGNAEHSEVVVSGLPIGRHNTNGMAIGPDGMLYIANGNSTDSGFGADGGPPEAPPYSGSLLRVSPTATGLKPQPSMVVATGWRNIFDIAFVPPGHPSLPAGLAAVPMNGPDGVTYNGIARPTGEDTLSLFSVTDGLIEHFGFPWCLYDRAKGGLAGFTQDPAQGLCDPLPTKASTGLPAQVVKARPVALFGTHVSANCLDFNLGGNFPAAMKGDLFVTEFGSNGGVPLIGHKVVRVHFGANGQVASVTDFMTDATPLGLTFGPDGSLWVADLAGTIYRISALP